MVLSALDFTSRKYYLADSSNKKLTNPIFDQVITGIDSYNIVTVGKYKAVVDPDLKFICPIIFNEISRVGDYFKVYIDKKCGLYDKKGNLVVDVLYDSIRIEIRSVVVNLLGENSKVIPISDLVNIKSKNPIFNVFDTDINDGNIIFKKDILSNNTVNKFTIVPFSKCRYNLCLNGKLAVPKNYDRISKIDNNIYLLWDDMKFEVYDTKNLTLLSGQYVDLSSKVENVYFLRKVSSTRYSAYDSKSRMSYTEFNNYIIKDKHIELNYDWGSTTIPIKANAIRSVEILSKNFKSDYKVGVLDKNPKFSLPIINPNVQNGFVRRDTMKSNKKVEINSLPIVDYILY